MKEDGKWGVSKLVRAIGSERLALNSYPEHLNCTDSTSVIRKHLYNSKNVHNYVSYQKSSLSALLENMGVGGFKGTYDQFFSNICEIYYFFKKKKIIEQNIQYKFSTRTVLFFFLPNYVVEEW